MLSEVSSGKIEPYRNKADLENHLSKSICLGLSSKDAFEMMISLRKHGH